MTPKEKALDIFNKMIVDFIDWTYCIPIDKKGDSTIQSEAKKRALIAVDEIIENLVDLSNGEFTFIHNVEYWQEVKEEINRL